MIKPKVAISWNASCGGCDESIVDIEEKILDIASQVEFVLWPCAMDFKYDNVRKMEDREITVSLINGSIQNSDQKEIVTILRQKSQLVVAFGSCASFGGIPALANLTSKDAIFRSSFLESPCLVNEEKVIPQPVTKEGEYTLTLPEIFETVYKLDDVIEVDYFLPGCPPTATMIVDTLTAILSGELPPKGSVLASDKALCSSCSRNETKPETIEIESLKRIHQVEADPELCFMAQGILCMGPATRDGCDYPCINGNMPCTGCMGPLPGTDQGAKMIGALGSVLSGKTEAEVETVLDGIVDPAGTFYRYSLSTSLLGRKREGQV